MNEHSPPPELPFEVEPEKKTIHRGNADVFIDVNDRLREVMLPVDSLVFRPKEGGLCEYLPPHSDESIAAEFGCSVHTVQHVRFTRFGKFRPYTNPPPAAPPTDQERIAALEADVAALKALVRNWPVVPAAE